MVLVVGEIGVAAFLDGAILQRDKNINNIVNAMSKKISVLTLQFLGNNAKKFLISSDPNDKNLYFVSLVK